MHTRDLLKKGQKVEKLALLQAWGEAGNLFDARERAALAWAETVTRVAETGVPDEAYQAARAVFEERELVDLTIAIGLMNAYNRLAISFRNTPQAAIESLKAASSRSASVGRVLFNPPSRNRVKENPPYEGLSPRRRRCQPNTPDHASPKHTIRAPPSARLGRSVTANATGSSCSSLRPHFSQIRHTNRNRIAGKPQSQAVLP